MVTRRPPPFIWARRSKGHSEGRVTDGCPDRRRLCCGQTKRKSRQLFERVLTNLCAVAHFPLPIGLNVLELIGNWKQPRLTIRDCCSMTSQRYRMRPVFRARSSFIMVGAGKNPIRLFESNISRVGLFLAMFVSPDKIDHLPSAPRACIHSTSDKSPRPNFSLMCMISWRP